MDFIKTANWKGALLGGALGGALGTGKGLLLNKHHKNIPDGSHWMAPVGFGATGTALGSLIGNMVDVPGKWGPGAREGSMDDELRKQLVALEAKIQNGEELSEADQKNYQYLQSQDL